MFDKVAAMLMDQLPLKKEDIKMESRLLEDLGADSANLMMLIMDMEQEFAITVEDEMLSKIKTVGDVVKYLEEHA